MNVGLPYDIYELVPYVDYFKIILIVLLVLGVISGLVFLMKKMITRFKQVKTVEVKKTPVQIVEELIEEVEAFSKFGLDFYEISSMKLRVGLELGFGFLATSMTTLELKTGIMSSSFDEKDRVEITRFFKVSDLVKFASYKTEESEDREFKLKVVRWLTSIKDLLIEKARIEQERKTEDLTRAEAKDLGTQSDSKKDDANL